MFSNFYSDTLNSFYENISGSFLNCHDSFFKIAGAYNTDSVKIPDGLSTLTACGHDICSYAARNNMVSFQYQAVMYLNGRLDMDKIKRATAYSVEEQPVLGCRLIEADEPYWERINSIDDIVFCTLEECNNSEEALRQFLQNTQDVKNDLNIRIRIIRTPETDILTMKINPSCFDGTGVKEYIKRLATIYTCIEKEGDASIPQPRLIEREEEHGLLKELGVVCPELSWNPQLDTAKRGWPFPWRHRGEDVADYAFCKLSKESFEKLGRYGDSKGATVNDLILTAYYRTLFKITGTAGEIPMDISSTVDLRRYLPGYAQTLRNFSGGFVTRIPRKSNETFDGTLSRVLKATKIIKENPSDRLDKTDKADGRQSSFTYFNDYFECVSGAGRAQGKDFMNTDIGCFPALFDLGNISENMMSFGMNTVTAAYLLPPVTRAPGLSILTSSYDGILTILAGCCQGFVSRKDMNEFLSRIKNELVRGCEPG